MFFRKYKMNGAFQASLNWIHYRQSSVLPSETVIPVGPSTRHLSNKVGPGIWEDRLFPLLPGKSFRNG